MNPQLQPFDPWTDAQTLAERLSAPQAELLVALGAEAWCQKCAAMRPAFEALHAQQEQPNLSWLWLDLEDHAEFIGDFVPEDLPLLLRWRAGALVRVAVLEAIDLAQPMPERLRELPLPPDAPTLWARFAQADWAC